MARPNESRSRNGRAIDRRSGESSDEARLEEELRALYAEVDVLYAGWSCPASTECCRFGVTGREPYVTSIELALVKRAILRRGKAIDKAIAPPENPTKLALPMLMGSSSLPGDASSRDQRPCPMLDGEGRCGIYQDRPFGCRTYYCDRATKASKIRHSSVNDLVRRLKDIAARHAPGGDEGRPLVRALGQGTRKSRAG